MVTSPALPAKIDPAYQPITAPDEFGIVWDSPSRHRPNCGTAIFATREDRDEAIAVLAHDLGYRYFTEYRDAYGYGLSYAAWYGVRSTDDAKRESTRNRRSYR